MREHDAFLRLICHEPDDTLARRIYADFLEEQGDRDLLAQAEFIRCQVQRAGLPWDDPRQAELLRRESQLTAAARRWTSSLTWRRECGPAFDDSPAWGRLALEYRRGFLEAAHIDVDDFLEIDKELFACFPINELHLRPGRTGRGLGELVGRESLGRLRHLRLAPPTPGREPFGDAGLRKVLSSSHLTGLEELDIDRQHVTDDGLAGLADWAGRLRLSRLRVGQNRMSAYTTRRASAAGVLALLRSMARAELARLELHNVSFSPAEAAQLAACRFGRLESVHAQHAGLRPESAAALASSPAWPELCRLSLPNNQLGATGVRLLASPATPARLVALDLSGNRVSDAAVASLCASPAAERVRGLALRRNGLGPAAARALASSARLAALRVLDLAHNDLGPEGAEALAGRDTLPGVRVLDLRGNALTNRQRHRVRAGGPDRLCRI